MNTSSPAADLAAADLANMKSPQLQAQFVVTPAAPRKFTTPANAGGGKFARSAPSRKFLATVPNGQTYAVAVPYAGKKNLVNKHNCAGERVDFIFQRWKLIYIWYIYIYFF